MMYSFRAGIPTRSHLKRALSLAVLHALAPAALYAQAGANTESASSETSFVIGMEEILVQGASNSTRNLLTSVDILGGDMVKQMNLDYGFSVVTQLPGVMTTDYHQGPTNGSFSVRGFTTEGGVNAVKQLTDGIPGNDRVGAMPMMDQIIPLDLASVEMVRGTTDPRYGLFNIAGNINVLTRQGGTYLDTKLTGGSFNTIEGQAAAGLEKNGFSQNYAISRRESDGYRDGASFDKTNANGKWFYESGRLSIGAIARYHDVGGREAGYLSLEQAARNPEQDNPVSATDFRGRTIKQYSLHVDFAATDELSLSGKIYDTNLDDLRFVRFSELFSQREDDINEGFTGGLFSFDYNPTSDAFFNFSLQGGLNYEEQDIHHNRYPTLNRVRTGTSFRRHHTLENLGGYVQAVLELTDWLKIVPAYRVDTFDGDFFNLVSGQQFPMNDYGDIHQPKLSAVATVSESLSVYANYGRTFQIGVGNAAYKIPPQVSDTDPSINKGWETGITYDLGDWLEARFAIWRQTSTGEIYPETLVSDFVNIGSTRREGADIQVTANLTDDLRIWGSLSHQESIIKVPNPATPQNRGNEINHVPNYLYSGGIDYALNDKWNFSLMGNGQSDYEIDQSNLYGRFGEYFLVNFDASYKVTDKITVSGQIRNLLDDEYEFVWWDDTMSSHSPNDPRAYYLSVQMAL
jgi:iron complex outermembrane receptor protein